MLRRIKDLGGSIDDLLLVYKLQMRCLTELGCPAWNGALTKKNISDLERLQKIALKIILGNKYSGYQNALEELKLPTLSDRRIKLCTNFVIKTAKNPKFASWFTKTKIKTRTSKTYVEHYARTDVYRKSPIFYLTKLLNDSQ